MRGVDQTNNTAGNEYVLVAKKATAWPFDNKRVMLVIGAVTGTAAADRFLLVTLGRCEPAQLDLLT